MNNSENAEKKKEFSGKRNNHHRQGGHHGRRPYGKDNRRDVRERNENEAQLTQAAVIKNASVPEETPETSAAFETTKEPVKTTMHDLPIDSPLFAKEKEPEDDSPRVEVVGIRFKKAGKVYFFAPGDLKLRLGDAAVVETARGPELGDVASTSKLVKEKDIVKPLRPVIRLATKEDIAHGEENRKKENEAFSVCLKKIEEHGLDMKLVDVEYTFDNSKLLFYFTGAGRVDFRELVKDLASVFRTRIELRQIGIRDETKIMGGLGVCGRALCCASFLSDFVQVSIKMAKEQNLSLNSTKISGTCGRLMCCLRYEHDTYEAEINLTPPVDSVVKTEDGVGTVVETVPLQGLLKVKLEGKNEGAPKYYHRDNVKVIKHSKRNQSADEEPDSEE